MSLLTATMPSCATFMEYESLNALTSVTMMMLSGTTGTESGAMISCKKHCCQQLDDKLRLRCDELQRCLNEERPVKDQTLISVPLVDRELPGTLTVAVWIWWWSRTLICQNLTRPLPQTKGVNPTHCRDVPWHLRLAAVDLAYSQSNPISLIDLDDCLVKLFELNQWFFVNAKTYQLQKLTNSETLQLKVICMMNSFTANPIPVPDW